VEAKNSEGEGKNRRRVVFDGALYTIQRDKDEVYTVISGGGVKCSRFWRHVEMVALESSRNGGQARGSQGSELS